ncbi:MAG: 4a-hydroxytetrahydrobiopterin dehydratase [Cryomorphaceae bacterium]|nr:4a-hydroxytetrahydrobiopterin dehydratase [Cryomorphaceae bacterium]
MNKTDWKENEDALHCTIKTDGYIEAVSIVVKIAMLAEEHKHHPTITLGYNTVDIRLTTHDAGNVVTDKDRKLSEAISANI